MEIAFEPNPIKGARNLRDHGISFAKAQEVFSDPNQIVSENYFVDGEQRYQIIGMTEGLVLLLVIYVDHSNPDREIVRIISARKAEAFEVSLYEDQIS
jgi:uncharacterized DUF497 family protein